MAHQTAMKGRLAQFNSNKSNELEGGWPNLTAMNGREAGSI